MEVELPFQLRVLDTKSALGIDSLSDLTFRSFGCISNGRFIGFNASFAEDMSDCDRIAADKDEQSVQVSPGRLRQD